LIEMMIASALLMLAAAGMMDIAVRVMREQARCSRQGALDSEAALVIEALVRDLSRARKVVEVSAAGSAAGSAVLPSERPDTSDQSDRSDTSDKLEKPNQSEDRKAPEKTGQTAKARIEVLSLLVDLPGPDGKTVETPVEYRLEGTRILRNDAPAKENSRAGAQVLAGDVERFVVERRGALLHVEVVCSSQTRAQRFESALKTDFHVGDLVK